MSLASGTRVGPYDIVGPLGVGGSASARVKDAHELRRDRAVAEDAR